MTLYSRTTDAIAAHAVARVTASVARLAVGSRNAEARRLRRVATNWKHTADRAWLSVAGIMRERM